MENKLPEAMSLFPDGPVGERWQLSHERALQNHLGSVTAPLLSTVHPMRLLEARCWMIIRPFRYFSVPVLDEYHRMRGFCVQEP